MQLGYFRKQIGAIIWSDTLNKARWLVLRAANCLSN